MINEPILVTKERRKLWKEEGQKKENEMKKNAYKEEKKRKKKKEIGVVVYDCFVLFIRVSLVSFICSLSCLVVLMHCFHFSLFHGSFSFY